MHGVKTEQKRGKENKGEERLLFAGKHRNNTANTVEIRPAVWALSGETSAKQTHSTTEFPPLIKFSYTENLGFLSRN